MSVSWHCISERSKGLFNRAIMMGGHVLLGECSLPAPDLASKLAKMIGYEGSDNEKEILEFLQKVDPVKIVEFQDTIEKNGNSQPFVPHIEHYTTNETFISKTPMELLRNAWSNDIDVLIGGVSDEGLAVLAELNIYPEILKKFKLQDIVPAEIDPNHPKVAEFIENVRRIYYPSSSEPMEDKFAYCQVCTLV